ncbi:MAG: hypothetical protein J1G38_02140 [Clostridiales bacterium]|nr:hypothetical protein [Clostridiales bacterium]
MLDKEITDLLTYAETHLMLDELDKARAARQIVRLLKLDGYSPLYETEGENAIDIDGLFSPHKLLEPLLNSAVERGVVKPEDKPELKAEIMDALILRPSEINDLFADTASVNRQKAFDFLYDYSVKSGYVDLVECAKNDRWEAKELKSKLEVIINVMPQAVVSGYPECALCYENEGYGKSANKRVVTTEICGEEWFFTYSRHQYFDKHGVLVNKTHTPPTGGKDALNKLACAAEFMGADGFVGSNALAENGGAKNSVHEHFQTGYRYAPELRAGYKTRYKSKDYPYIELGTVDWYNTVIRLSHSNLEKTVEFADKLISAWTSYSDERIANADGKKNFVNIVCRKIGGKYVFDIILRSNGMKKHKTPAEYNEIKADALGLTDLLGYFVLPNKLSEQLQNVRLYLDGTKPFDKAALDGEAKPFAGMIERMLKDQGGTVTSLEAKLNLHDEIDVACEKILASTAVFDGETIKPFFESIGIYEL